MLRRLLRAWNKSSNDLIPKTLISRKENIFPDLHKIGNHSENKNNFAKVSRNLSRHRSKNNFVWTIKIIM